jgi:hypothetical protein
MEREAKAHPDRAIITQPSGFLLLNIRSLKTRKKRRTTSSRVEEKETSKTIKRGTRRQSTGW